MFIVRIKKPGFTKKGEQNYEKCMLFYHDKK